jgi:hypothetical protein
MNENPIQSQTVRFVAGGARRGHGVVLLYPDKLAAVSPGPSSGVSSSGLLPWRLSPIRSSTSSGRWERPSESWPEGGPAKR